LPLNDENSRAKLQNVGGDNSVDIRSWRTARSDVLEMILVIVGAVALTCRGHQELVLTLRCAGS
jgi:hypothetical protein